MRTIDNAATLAAAWRKSSFSGGDNNCVEVAPAASGAVYVRDSKNPTGPAHQISGSAWAAFLAGVRAGEFDLT